MLKLNLAKKLLCLLEGEKIPASKMKHSEVNELLSENILTEVRQGRTKSVYQLRNFEALHTYLFNRYDINDLRAYIDVFEKEEITKSELTLASSDSKTRAVRSFKGFLVNSYDPIPATLNDEPIIIHPVPGTFQFIYDYEFFSIDKEITVVGIENTENFRQVEKQRYLFKHINPLFISRYPQTQHKDLIRWLQDVPNPYLHFGDFDLSGIRIFLSEYYRYLGNKATFFIPPNIEFLLKNYGNSKRYNDQLSPNITLKDIADEKLLALIKLIHSYKKGVDQEILIGGL